MELVYKMMNGRRGTWIKRIGSGMLDLLYPPGLYCISCGKIIDASRTYYLCNDCMESMNWITDRHCGRCGRPLAENDPGELCFGCAGMEAAGMSQAFDKGHACSGYGACEQSLIFSFKYGGRSDIGDILGEALYDRMSAEYGSDVLAGMYDLVIPVPVFKEKKSKRGFNHADLMAQSFAKRAGLCCDPGAVVRVRDTVPMKGLSPEERRANISGAFRVRASRLPRISGARILIVDDIFTVGSTVGEIGRILKEPDSAAQGGRDPDASDYRARHTARIPGAARVDFLTFAAAGDYLAV